MSPGTTTQEKLGSALFYGIVAILAYLAFRVFEPFLASLAWAVILVVLFFPMYERLAKKWGMTTAAVASTIGVTLILIVPDDLHHDRVCPPRIRSCAIHSTASCLRPFSMGQRFVDALPRSVSRC